MGFKQTCSCVCLLKIAQLKLLLTFFWVSISIHLVTYLETLGGGVGGWGSMGLEPSLAPIEVPGNWTGPYTDGIPLTSVGAPCLTKWLTTFHLMYSKGHSGFGWNEVSGTKESESFLCHQTSHWTHASLLHLYPSWAMICMLSPVNFPSLSTVLCRGSLVSPFSVFLQLPNSTPAKTAALASFLTDRLWP